MSDGRTDAQKRADKKYRETKVKRIPLDVAREDADRWKTAAEDAGEPLNVYIKKAVETRIKEEESLEADPRPDLQRALFVPDP